ERSEIRELVGGGAPVALPVAQVPVPGPDGERLGAGGGVGELGQADLPLVGGADLLAGDATGRGQRGEQERDQQRDHRDDDQQLDDREGAAGAVSGHVWLLARVRRTRWI